MASTIRVDALQDTGGNNIITSDSAGTFTYAAASGANFTALDADNVSAGTLAIARGGTGGTVGPGKVLQVVTATDSTERSTTSTSLVTASNTLSVDITPAATSSKVLVITTFNSGNSSGSDTRYTIKKC